MEGLYNITGCDLLGIRSPSETTDYINDLEDSRRPEHVDLQEQSTFTTGLQARVHRAWQAARSNKTIVEHNMLECLRERKGEYSAPDLQRIRNAGGSEIYVKLPTAKIRAGIAHIKSILLPAGEHAHGLAPTKNPSLPGWMEDAIMERITENPNAVDDEGNPIDPADQAEMLEHMAKRELQLRAKRSAQGMEKQINDQLEEGGWSHALSDFIDDFCTYPAAFLKGPYQVKKQRIVHKLGSSGVYEQEVTTEIVDEFRTINPFDAYPAPGVDSIHKGDFIERLRLNRSDLHGMMNLPGFNNDALEAALRDHGIKRLDNWLWTDSARHAIADHQYFWYHSTTEIDGLHWYGMATGIELLEQGVDPDLIPDPLKEYEVDAILVGPHLIRVVLNTDPLYRRPIHSTCYEKIPGSVFGNSPSMLMRSSTRMVNGTARALQNNLAHASGFQVEIDYTRLHAETDPFDIHPFKVWQGRESEMTGDRPAVRFFQPDSNADQLLMVMDKFKAMADSDTGIPDFLHGSQGGGEGADATARGRAMLLDQSAKLLRSSINNIDEDVVTPKLEMMYDKNMLDENIDPGIKGDAQIVAKGANAMLQREGARQQHMALLEILNNDIDQQIVGLGGRTTVVKSLIDTFEEIDTDAVVPSDEELEAKIAKIENAPPPPDPAQIKAEADLQIAQMEGEIKAQEIQQNREFKLNDMTSARMLKQMEMQQQSEEARIRNDREVQDELIRMRAQRLSAREEMEVDIMKAKLQAEATARLKIAEMKMQHKTAMDQAKLNARSAADTAAANQPDAIGEDQIRAVVEEAVAQKVDVLMGETSKIMDEITKQLTSEGGSSSGEITLNVNMPDCKPASKKVKVGRNPDGSLEGTITPEGASK